MKILHITSELDGGGVERLLYDYCTRMVPDIHFDFVVTSEKEGILEKKIEDLGCNIFRVSKFRSGVKNHERQMLDIIKKGEYDIIHDHSGYKAFFNLKIAKKLGIKVRIAHAHQAFMTETRIACVIRKIVTLITKYYATQLFACGIDAAEWMWGKKTYQYGKVEIMTNAISIPNFVFSEEARNEIRKELGLTNKFIIGNVARFSYQKNHDFLIDIFREVKKQNGEAILLLVGGGELETDIKLKICDYGLSNSVIFLGIRDDVPRLMSAMDVFALPSRFEGLPVTLVEAQAASLPSFASDSITKEIKITNYLTYISLAQSAKEWADEILHAKNRKRKDISYDIIKGGYDIESEAHKMKEYYFSIIDS